MAVKVACPNSDCKVQYQVPQDRLGQSAKCKKCGLTFTLQMSADETLSPGGSVSKSAAPQAGSSRRSMPQAKPLDSLAPEPPGGSAGGRQAAPPEPLPKIGPYQVKRLLGAGAMGHVYLAHDPHLDRDVAIKVLPREFAADPERISRFLREARLAAKIQQPNTVVIYQVAVEDGLASIVMELVDGGSLDEVVEKRGPLPWREATRAIRDAAAGLAAAHEIGLVHRDVKPANLMCTSKGTVKIVDFGLVRAMEGASQLTQKGTILGTPTYMAPEQWMGQAADARSDLYSLVCTYYYLLTGKEPFEAASIPAMGYQHRYEPFPDARQLLPDLPPAACRILAGGTEKDPAQRFQTAAELIAALDELLAMSDEEMTYDEILNATAGSMAPEKRPARQFAIGRRQGAATCAAAANPWRRWAPVLGCVLLAVVALPLLAVVFWSGSQRGPSKVAQWKKPAKAPEGKEAPPPKPSQSYLILDCPFADLNDTRVVVDNAPAKMSRQRESGPFRIELKPGQHTLEISRGGYETIRRDVLDKGRDEFHLPAGLDTAGGETRAQTRGYARAKT